MSDGHDSTLRNPSQIHRVSFDVCGLASMTRREQVQRRMRTRPFAVILTVPQRSPVLNRIDRRSMSAVFMNVLIGGKARKEANELRREAALY